MTATARRISITEALDAAHDLMVSGHSPAEIERIIAEQYAHVCWFDGTVFHFAQYGTERATLPLIAPESNTEAAQLDADLAERLAFEQGEADDLAAEMPHLGTCLCDTCSATRDAAEYAASMLRTRRLTSQPAMLDPIASLPLFSGTAPRVADPGRFDPPQISTDTQPSLF